MTSLPEMFVKISALFVGGIWKASTNFVFQVPSGLKNQDVCCPGILWQDFFDVTDVF